MSRRRRRHWHGRPRRRGSWQRPQREREDARDEGVRPLWDGLACAAWVAVVAMVAVVAATALAARGGGARARTPARTPRSRRCGAPREPRMVTAVADAAWRGVAWRWHAACGRGVACGVRRRGAVWRFVHGVWSASRESHAVRLFEPVRGFVLCRVAFVPMWCVSCLLVPRGSLLSFALVVRLCPLCLAALTPFSLSLVVLFFVG